MRQTERAYKRSQAVHIEEMSTNNPTEFWKKINQLGPRKSKEIPMEIVDSEGNTMSDKNSVSERWRTDFKNLYNRDDDGDFDDAHYHTCKIYKQLLEHRIEDPLYTPNNELNNNISIDEIRAIVMKAKTGSAYGYDRIPYDVLKFPPVIAVLHQLFQLIFDSSIIPSPWRKAIICPILKDPNSDKRLPLNYRGVSLLSCISKLYSSFLNKRLVTYFEGNDILADEQNGFRANRSCEDHIFTLDSIVRNNKSVYSSFIDLKKCFDFIDRDMLLYKLLLNNVDGKIYNSIKNIYASTSASVRINGTLTDWFDCATGVKQGCTLSPTLFSIFANDLVHEINDLDLGIVVGDKKVSILMFADDIVLVTDSEDSLQTLLNTLHEWCRRWRVLINTKKSKCIHFRGDRAKRSERVFKIGDNILETVDQYKYLGVIFHEKNNFSINCETLSKAAGRALGGIINKIHSFKTFSFGAFEKLYNSCVVPILDYGASVWGFKTYQSADNVDLRALRYFLGVHRFAPNLLALYGDAGWTPSVYRRWLCILRYWNRLVLMDNNRLTKHAFNNDYTTSVV